MGAGDIYKVGEMILEKDKSVLRSVMLLWISKNTKLLEKERISRNLGLSWRPASGFTDLKMAYIDEGVRIGGRD